MGWLISKGGHLGDARVGRWAPVSGDNGATEMGGATTGVGAGAYSQRPPGNTNTVVRILDPDSI